MIPAISGKVYSERHMISGLRVPQAPSETTRCQRWLVGLSIENCSSPVTDAVKDITRSGPVGAVVLQLGAAVMYSRPTAVQATTLVPVVSATASLQVSPYTGPHVLGSPSQP